MSQPPQRPRILSGMRPTGKLHLGNYMGALRNWVRLQNELDENGHPKYDCYFFIADYHALTTDYADPSQLQQNTLDVALDWLAAGLDPAKSTLFVQSHVPQHAELHLLFSMITPLGWLERVPSYKDQQENITGKDLTTYGFLGYPLLQAADILIYGSPGVPLFVPVGADQVAHVELTREVARRFNSLYKSRVMWSHATEQTAEEFSRKGIPTEVGDIVTSPFPTEAAVPPLVEPEEVLTMAPRLPGTDGRKMSKSYGNTINLGDRPQFVLNKLLDMPNGGQRLHISDPGNPDICPVGDLHKAVSPLEITELTRAACSAGTISCAKCKALASDSVWTILAPIQGRLFEVESGREKVLEILRHGAQHAALIAKETLDAVRSSMGLLSPNVEIAAAQMEFYRGSRHNVFNQLSESVGAAHDLASKAGFWHAPKEDRSDFLRDYWKNKMLPPDVSLRQLTSTSFVTSRNMRIFVRTSRELTSDIWHFEVQNKTAEAIVFLSWDQKYMLRDFVVPQKVYRLSWPKTKEKIIDFYIHKRDDRFFLRLPDQTEADISDMNSRYEFLR